MGILEPLAWGIAAATLVLALTARRGDASSSAGNTRLGSRFLVPAVVLAGHWGLKHRLPHVPPREALEWTIWASLIAACLPDIWALKRPARWGVLGGVVLLMCLAVLKPRLAYLPASEATALFLGAASLWTAVTLCAKPATPFVLESMLVTTTGAAVCLSHSFVGAALIAGAFCFALGGAWMVRQLGLGRVPEHWILGPGLLVLGGLVLSGVAYGELAPGPALCLAGSLCAPALLSRLQVGGSPRPWRGLLAGAALVAVANWLAWPEASLGYGEGDYGYSGASDGPSVVAAGLDAFA